MDREDLPHRARIERAPEQVAEDEAIRRRFRSGPTLDKLEARDELSAEDAAAIQAQREAGPSPWPARELVAALRGKQQRRSLSDSDLAEAPEIDRAAIHKIETGLNRNPTIATLMRLARAMGLELAWSLRPAAATDR